MGQADTVADSGRILYAAQSHSEVVLGGGRVPAYFKGTDVAMLATAVNERRLNMDGQKAYRIASQREN